MCDCEKHIFQNEQSRARHILMEKAGSGGKQKWKQARSPLLTNRPDKPAPSSVTQTCCSLVIVLAYNSTTMSVGSTSISSLVIEMIKLQSPREWHGKKECRKVCTETDWLNGGLKGMWTAECCMYITAEEEGEEMWRERESFYPVGLVAITQHEYLK